MGTHGLVVKASHIGASVDDVVDAVKPSPREEGTRVVADKHSFRVVGTRVDVVVLELDNVGVLVVAIAHYDTIFDNRMHEVHCNYLSLKEVDTPSFMFLF